MMSIDICRCGNFVDTDDDAGAYCVDTEEGEVERLNEIVTRFLLAQKGSDYGTQK